jgi:hypothetical protein
MSGQHFFILTFILFLNKIMCILSTHTLDLSSTYLSTTNFHEFSAQETDGSKCSDNDGFEPLNKLISTLKIDIPDISIKGIKDVEYLNLTNIMCQDFEVGDIELGTNGPVTQPVVFVDLSGNDIECSCEVVAKVIGIKVLTGLDATLSDVGVSTEADLTFGTVPGYPAYRIPMKAASEDCQITLDVKLKFSGSFVGDILEILSNVIDKQIKSEVQSAACEALNGLINNGTSGLFEVIDAGVTKFIGPPQPRPTPHLPDEQMVPFSTNKLLEAITDWIAQPQVVNDLVDCVTNHTGVAQIRNMNISFDLGMIISQQPI